MSDKTPPRMLLTFAGILYALSLPGFARGGTFIETLGFIPPPDSSIVGYEALAGGELGSYDVVQTVAVDGDAPAGSVLEFQLELPDDRMSFVVMRSFNAGGMRSDPSNFLVILPPEAEPPSDPAAPASEAEPAVTDSAPPDGGARPTDADFNADGYADLLWQNPATGEYRIWLMRGEERLAAHDLGSVAAGTELRATGDFDGDGHSDIFWFDPASRIPSIWFVREGERVADQILPTAAAGWEPVGAGDANADGICDIFWHDRIRHSSVLWVVESDGRVRQSGLPRSDPGWLPAAIDDFDGDGQADLLWHHQTSLGNAMWLLRNGQYQRQVIIPASSPGWSITGTGDLDGNGRADVLWSRDGATAMVAWMIGSTFFDRQVVLPTPPAPSAGFVAAPDLDGDGRSDLVWHREDDAEIEISLDARDASAQRSLLSSVDGWVPAKSDLGASSQSLEPLVSLPWFGF